MNDLPIPEIMAFAPTLAQYRFDVFPGDFKMQNPKRPTCKKYTQ